VAISKDYPFAPGQLEAIQAQRDKNNSFDNQVWGDGAGVTVEQKSLPQVWEPGDSTPQRRADIYIEYFLICKRETPTTHSYWCGSHYSSNEAEAIRFFDYRSALAVLDTLPYGDKFVTAMRKEA
jgi:hypothetical protein